MYNIHKLSNLPSQCTINSIAFLGHEFTSQQLEFEQVVNKLKILFNDSKFMLGRDNSIWMNIRGHDFFNNPKLFAQAPLTYVCAFLSELFKSYEPEEIKSRVQPAVLYQALKRLQDFILPSPFKVTC
ncbi:MAG: hypothetical protein GY787_31750 [Alteromonadales bacterium]|nr:hypothetical protein [Alteromonadales bacterium]